MKEAIIEVDVGLMMSAIGLPADTKFRGASYEKLRDVLQIRIEHADLDEVGDGDKIPTIVPTIERRRDGVISLVDWGK